MLTIAWDVDDVLNDLMRMWFEQQWLPAHPDCQASYADLRANPPETILGATRDEYLCSLDTFRRTHYAELAPLPEAVAWFERCGDEYRHMALTAVPLQCAPLSAAWVVRHFGRWIRSFHFVPSPRNGESIPQYDRNKRDFLGWFGKADVLVDDMPANVDSARDAGVRAVLMPRPWNGGRENPADAFRKLEHL
jgi:hypothetical protein